MPISFPHKKDVTLKTPPLSEVICQVRFAPILRIAEELPSGYQELLRKRFPKFAKREPFRVEVKGIGGSTPTRLPNEFVCETADGNSRSILGLDFLALTTRRYLHWKSFSRDLKIILKAFEKIYGIILSTRIGLRYVNHLTCANTHTNSLQELVDVLNSELTHYYYNKIWTPPEKVTSLILLPGNGQRLAVRIAIESVPDARVILDYDCYTELDNPTKMKVSKILQTVDQYHRLVYNAFRWSIREKKMVVFKPLR